MAECRAERLMSIVRDPERMNRSDERFSFDGAREMGERGFEPLKAEPTGLQPVPFGRSGTPPRRPAL